MNETMSDELSRLRAENARLRTLLACHGIAADEPEPMSPQKSVLSLEEKVALFRNLFPVFVTFKDLKIYLLIING